MYRKGHLKIHTESQGPLIFKTILRKKNKARSLTLPDFKTYYRATVIKTMVLPYIQIKYKDKHTDQWNRTDILEINPCIYDQMIFNKVANTAQ